MAEDATISHQRESGEGCQWLTMRARGLWLAMDGERGWQAAMKAMMPAQQQEMMRAGGGQRNERRTAKQAWTQQPTIDGRVAKTSGQQ